MQVDTAFMHNLISKTRLCHLLAGATSIALLLCWFYNHHSNTKVEIFSYLPCLCEMNIQTLTFYNITQFAPQRRCNVYTKVTKNIQNIFDYIYLFFASSHHISVMGQILETRLMQSSENQKSITLTEPSFFPIFIFCDLRPFAGAGHICDAIKWCPEIYPTDKATNLL